MKILLITPSLPYPLDTGGRQAVFNIIERMQYEAEVHLVYYHQTKQDKFMPQINKLLPQVVLHPFSKQKFSLSYLFLVLEAKLKEKVLFSNSNSYIFNPDYSQTSHFFDFLNNVVKSVKPDLIQTEFYDFQNLAFALPDNLPKVFVQHEIRSVLNKQRNIQIATTDTYLKYMYKKTDAYEVCAMNHYDSVFTLTELDKQKLLDLNVNVPIYCSPAGISIEGKRNKYSFDNKLVFVGGGAHRPNYESLLWFVQRVWADLKRERVNIKLRVVGSWNRTQIDKIKSIADDIEFTGFVPDLKTEYKGAISIVPITTGSGMRMKILDAAIYGAPFITTSIGVQGMPFKNMESCYVADKPVDFKERIVELLDSEELRFKFYLNAFNIVNEFYSMDSLAKRRIDYYKEIIDDFRNQSD